MNLRSPLTGNTLHRFGHVLEAGAERWPIVDDIAFLRADRRDLADHVLQHLESGDENAALVMLLGDQDGWARTPPPSEADRIELLARRDSIGFRQAMDLLALGPVATYFAHRWSDPTLMSGLALAQAYWTQPRRVLEVACGAGHFLPSFASADEVVGGDLVFAKLWLARHFVAPDAQLVCFDAAEPWPFADQAADLVFCHDAFYFLPNKADVAREMMRVGEQILVGHTHNRLTENLSAGQPLSPGGYADLFQGCTLFDDRELTQSLVDLRKPVPASAEDLNTAAAIAIAWPGGSPISASGDVSQPKPGRKLSRNPLYEQGEIVWPSDRYEREYAALATYPVHSDAPASAWAGQSPDIDRLALNRVLVELPPRW